MRLTVLHELQKDAYLRPLPQYRLPRGALHAAHVALIDGPYGTQPCVVKPPQPAVAGPYLFAECIGLLAAVGCGVALPRVWGGIVPVRFRQGSATAWCVPYLESCTDMGMTPDPELCLRLSETRSGRAILAMDEWIGNPDRHGGNVLSCKGRLLAVDHDQCLGGWSALLLDRPNDVRGLLARQVLGPEQRRLRAAASAAVRRCHHHRKVLDAIARDVPIWVEELLPKRLRMSDILDYLRRRCDPAWTAAHLGLLT